VCVSVVVRSKSAPELINLIRHAIGRNLVCGTVNFNFIVSVSPFAVTSTNNDGSRWPNNYRCWKKHDKNGVSSDI
jgi:hypothetical protein